MQFSNIFKWFLVSMVIFMLSACGGGSKSSENNNSNAFIDEDNIGNGKLGYFYDINISNLEYRTTENVGKTKNSKFYYQKGDNIELFIDGIFIGKTEAKEHISIFDVIPYRERILSDKLLNILVLLKTYDKDHNLDNGIIIDNQYNNINNASYNKMLNQKTLQENINIDDNHLVFIKKLEKRVEVVYKVDNYNNVRDRYGYTFDERVKFLTQKDYENSYWIRRYIHYLDSLNYDLRIGEQESFDSYQEKVNKMVLFLDGFKDLADAITEDDLLRAVMLAEGIHKIAYSVDIKFMKEDEAEQVFSVLEILVLSEKSTTSINDYIKIFEDIGIILEYEFFEDFFNTYGDMLKRLKDSDLISSSHNKKRAIIDAMFSLAKTTIMYSIEGSNWDKATDGILRDSTNAMFNAVIGYVKCGKKFNSQCIDNIYNIYMDGFAKPIWKVTAAIRNYSIWSDNRESAESFQKESYALQYFLNINFDTSIIREDIERNSNWYEVIDFLTNNGYWDSLENEIENRYEVDFNFDENDKHLIIELIKNKERIIEASKGILRLGSDAETNSVYVSYIDPIAKGNNTSKAISCTLDGKEIIKNKQFNGSFDENFIYFNTSVTHTFECSVTNGSIEARKEYISFSDNDHMNAASIFYAPICPLDTASSPNFNLYITELVLDNNYKSYLGEKITTTRKRKHDGIDLRAPINTNIVSAMDGKVIGVRIDGYNENHSYGKYVLIKHNNLIVRYAHLDRVVVNNGQYVKAGELIAKSGDSGSPGQPHLHFEVRENDIVVDPLKNKLFHDQDDIVVENYYRGHASVNVKSYINCGFTNSTGSDSTPIRQIPTKPILKSPGTSMAPGTILSNTVQTLAWNVSERATYYWVAVRNTVTGQLVLNQNNLNGLSISTSALTQGHKYYWNISACNDDGCSEWANPLYFQIKSSNGASESLTLNTPISTCNNNTPTISMSWNGIDNVSAYKIHSNRVFPSGTYFKDVPNGQTSIVLSNGLNSNYSYRLYVRAELSNGQTQDSNEITVNTGNCDNSAGGGDAPDKPSSLTPGSNSEPYPELSNTNITLGWGSVNDATYYKVTLFDLNTINKILDGVRVNGNSYDASNNLRMGHRYYWEVKACNDNGCSSNRRVYFNIEGEVVAPSKPIGLSPGNRAESNPEMVDSTTVILNWDNTSGASYYKVYVATGSVGNSGVIVVRGARTNNTSYTLSSLDRGQKYQWWVDACNDDECTESDWYGFEVEAPPVGTPTNLSVSVNDTSINTTWSGVNNATKYRVRLYDEDGDDDRSEYTTNTSINLSGLSRGHRYKIKIKAYIGERYGSYTSYKYFNIEEENTPLCPLRHFVNNRITEYLQRGYADGYDGKTQIEGLQKFLNEIGYNPGTADGIFGEQTEQAVIAYQNDKGLTADGKVGPNTRSAINNTNCD